MDLDVAVVGGGVSGAYSAWRLQQEKGAKSRVALFEYSDRIGGRLYTVTMPGLPHVKAEVGGMRYIPDQHIMVADLVKHLGLATKNFPDGRPASPSSRTATCSTCAAATCGCTSWPTPTKCPTTWRGPSAASDRRTSRSR